jgi:hypothetical protein
MSTDIFIARPRMETDAALQELLQAQEERCTIVHCRLFTESPTRVRIWPETFLVEENNERRKLLNAFNISLMPHWTYHEVYNGYIRFTLVFEGLGKDCRQFHLLEEIPEPGGFYSHEIARNHSDVYEVEVFAE